MINDIHSKKRLASSWFKLLQQTICYEFEKIESDYGKKVGKMESGEIFGELSLILGEKRIE